MMITGGTALPMRAIAEWLSLRIALPRAFVADDFFGKAGEMRLGLSCKLRQRSEHR